MTANDTTPDDRESVTEAQHDASTQIIMGEVLVEPQAGEVTIDTRDAGRLVKLELGSDGRGVKLQALLDAEQARAVADRLTTAAEEVAANE